MKQGEGGSDRARNGEEKSVECEGCVARREQQPRYSKITVDSRNPTTASRNVVRFKRELRRGYGETSSRGGKWFGGNAFDGSDTGRVRGADVGEGGMIE